MIKDDDNSNQDDKRRGEKTRRRREARSGGATKGRRRRRSLSNGLAVTTKRKSFNGHEECPGQHQIPWTNFLLVKFFFSNYKKN